MQSVTTTMSSLAALSRLFRLPLSGMVALTAIAGALAANPWADVFMLWALAWGIFLLSASCSVLNQVQERFTDALMTRTCHRPMACGLLSSRAGAFIGLVTGSTGLLILYLGSGSSSALLGLGATAWYLLLYTPLKRVNSFAVVAGTPCGMLPPLIGWQAAGGALLSPQVLTLALLMLLWQVPHFWLLALPDRDEFELAGFKVLPKNLSNQKLLQVCHFWIMGLVSTTLLLPLLQLLWQPAFQGLAVGFALSFAIWTSILQRKVLFIEQAARRLKFGLHLYLALIIGLLLLQNLLARFGT